MQLNRQSYEEFFLLYADGELSHANKKAVEEFVQENPDLADEFAIVQETIFHPDESVIFEDKELLYRSEEEERRIVYMRWLRISAAAAIMIALTVVGWLFVDRKEMHHQPVAMKQSPVKAADSAPKNTIGIVTDSNKSNPDINITRQSTEAAESEQKLPNPAPRTHTVNRTFSDKTHKTINDTKKEEATEESIPEPEVALQTEPPTHEVANTDAALAPIDVTVRPHAIEQKQEDAPGNSTFAKATYDDEPEKNDMIYFANTSLTKKTKLREIFRKTTRYIDRVTSLQ